LITAAEIIDTHQTISTYQSQLSPDVNDPIRVVLKDLGVVPEKTEDDTRDISLTLESRFKTSLEDISPEGQLYEETKELIIKVFKKIPMRTQPPFTLMSILKQAETFANSQKVTILQKNVKSVFENMQKLEKSNTISAKDDYVSLLKDIAREVANRAERILAQKKEVERLTAAIKKLTKHGEMLKTQISEFEKYLQGCRTNASKKARDKKKPVKLTHKELLKMRIIEETKIPEEEQPKVRFFFTMGDIGKFTVESKVDGQTQATKNLDLEDLLERKDSGERTLDFNDKVIFAVPNLILPLKKCFFV